MIPPADAGAARAEQNNEPSELAACGYEGLPSPDGAIWLLPRVQSPEGMQQVLQQLQSCVTQDSFQDRLTNAQKSAKYMMDSKLKKSTDVGFEPQGAAEIDHELGQAQCEAEDPNDSLLRQLMGEGIEQPGGPLDEKPFYEEFDADVNFEDECVVIEHTDAVDAVADFIAKCVVVHPQACNLTAAQLQVALTKTIKEMQKSRGRKLWDWSKSLYKGGAWTYGVANAYTHPWIIKAVLVGVWQTIKLMGAALPIGL